MENEVELVGWRTETSKTFWNESSGEYRQVISEGPMHQNQGGYWVDFSTDVVDRKVETSLYSAEILPYPAIGYQCTSKVSKSGERFLEADLTKAVKPQLNKNMVFFENVDRDTDVSIVFHLDRICFFRRLKSSGAPLEMTYRISKIPEDQFISTEAVDAKGQIIRAESTITRGKKEDIVTQVVSPQAVIIDPETRVRSYSDDIFYPIIVH